MHRPHLTIHKIREVIRLHFGEGLSLRQTASSLSIPLTTVADCVKRSKAAGLSWPLGNMAGSLRNGASCRLTWPNEMVLAFCSSIC